MVVFLNTRQVYFSSLEHRTFQSLQRMQTLLQHLPLVTQSLRRFACVTCGIYFMWEEGEIVMESKIVATLSRLLHFVLLSLTSRLAMD